LVRKGTGHAKGRAGEGNEGGLKTGSNLAATIWGRAGPESTGRTGGLRCPAGDWRAAASRGISLILAIGVAPCHHGPTAGLPCFVSLKRQGSTSRCTSLCHHDRFSQIKKIQYIAIAINSIPRVSLVFSPSTNCLFAAVKLLPSVPFHQAVPLVASANSQARG